MRILFYLFPRLGSVALTSCLLTHSSTSLLSRLHQRGCKQAPKNDHMHQFLKVEAPISAFFFPVSQCRARRTLLGPTVDTGNFFLNFGSPFGSPFGFIFLFWRWRPLSLCMRWRPIISVVIKVVAMDVIPTVRFWLIPWLATAPAGYFVCKKQ
jgi:hypothetical protein